MSVTKEEAAADSEEKLLERFYIELSGDRRRQETERKARNGGTERARRWAYLPLLVSILGTIVAVLVPVLAGGDDVVKQFRYLAVSAAFVAAVAAVIGLWSHKHSDVGDHLSKALGFTSAFVALVATFFLTGVIG